MANTSVNETRTDDERSCLYKSRDAWSVFHDSDAIRLRLRAARVHVQSPLGHCMSSSGYPDHLSLARILINLSTLCKIRLAPTRTGRNVLVCQRCSGSSVAVSYGVFVPSIAKGRYTDLKHTKDLDTRPRRSTGMTETKISIYTLFDDSPVSIRRPTGAGSCCEALY